MSGDAFTASAQASSPSAHEGPQKTVLATSSASHSALTGLPAWLGVAMLSATVCALGLGLYDQYVRQPRTPRLAVVDIAKLFAAAERTAKEGVLGPAAGVGAGSTGPRAGGSQAATPAAELLAAANAAENFGPSVERVLSEISSECQCAIVAMAAVVGGNSTVPDYTQEAARRLGLLMRSPQSERFAPQR